MVDLYVATNGMSVWQSADSGDTLLRTATDRGIYSCTQVWSLGTHPKRPDQVIAGTNTGIYMLDRKSKYWLHVPSPMDEFMAITSLESPADNPSVIIAGTQPAAIFRSDDGGKSWTKGSGDMKAYSVVAIRNNQVVEAPELPPGVVNKAWTRITQVVFDPKNVNRLWAGVEIDGLWSSVNGGLTWEKAKGLLSDDVHGVAVIYENDRPVIYATTNVGLHISRDDGKTWEVNKIDSFSQYTRAVISRADDKGVMFMTNGDGPPGTRGRVYRSKDYGRTWNDVNLPGEVRSSIYSIAINPADPKLVFVASNLGQIYRSEDGGDNWVPLKRQLPEVRTLAWMPSAG